MYFGELQVKVMENEQNYIMHLGRHGYPHFYLLSFFLFGEDEFQASKPLSNVVGNHTTEI